MYNNVYIYIIIIYMQGMQRRLVAREKSFGKSYRMLLIRGSATKAGRDGIRVN